LLSTNQPGFINVSIDEAQSMTALALKKIGWDDDDANLQAEIMTAAELCGNNQGLVKMYQPAMMAPSPDAAKPTVERETPTSAGDQCESGSWHAGCCKCC
jgi:LDH2 family malate/lactate/ureidoglycolate dehydrogenase